MQQHQWQKHQNLKEYIKDKYKYIKSYEKETFNILYVVSCHEIVNTNKNIYGLILIIKTNLDVYRINSHK